jgi:hypothetical protein
MTNPSRAQSLGKIQVQIAAVLVLAAAYVMVWPGLRPVDPLSPVAFIVEGGLARLVCFALLVWAMSAVTAVITVSSRAEGALLAAMVGAGAVSLRTAPFRPLLWTFDRSMRGLYVGLAVETLLYAVVILVALAVVVFVRRRIASFQPGWVQLDSPLPAPPQKGLPAPARFFTLEELWGQAMNLFRKPAGSVAARLSPQARAEVVRTAMGFLAVGLLVSLALLWILLQSVERGQVLFALAVAMWLGVLAAHQVFATSYVALAWLIPIALGVILYAIAGVSYSGMSPQEWMQVAAYAQVLPADWLSAGAGGALFGCWTSIRIYELRYLEKLQETGV